MSSLNAQTASRRNPTRGGEKIIPVCIVSENLLVAKILKKHLKPPGRFHIVKQRRLPVVPHFGDSVAIVDHISPGLNPAKLSIAFSERIILIGDLREDEICRFLLLGVNGFVRYYEVERKLRKAVEVVSTGRLYVSRADLERFIGYMRTTNASKVSGSLTRRQEQILRLLENGCTNKEISSRLEISENTVKFHLANIYSKLGVNDRHTAVNQMHTTLARTDALGAVAHLNGANGIPDSSVHSSGATGLANGRITKVLAVGAGGRAREKSASKTDVQEAERA